MSIRELINTKPAISIALTATALGAVIAFASLKSGARTQPHFLTLAFYTSDDGATLFTDDIQRIAPFENDGREAVRAYVFTTDDNQHHWVQFLEKWSEDGKKQLTLMRSTAPGALAIPGVKDILVKKPGGHEWVNRADPKARDILQPKAPPETPQGPASLVNP